MTRKKESTEAKRSKRTSSSRKRSRKAVDLAEIRQQITNLVGNDAVCMVETTIEAVSKGHYLGMKYLFEMIGLYWENRGRGARQRLGDGNAAAPSWSSGGANPGTESYQGAGNRRRSHG
jgi:hypothetical protein